MKKGLLSSLIILGMGVFLSSCSNNGKTTVKVETSTKAVETTTKNVETTSKEETTTTVIETTSQKDEEKETTTVITPITTSGNADLPWV